MSTYFELYGKAPTWKIIDDALKDLEENNDIEITTVREFVVGYIVKKIEEHK